MCMVDDDTCWEFFDERSIRTARKPHKCDECLRTIQPGEPYRRSNGRCEGNFYSYSTCAHCEQVTRWLTIVCHGYLFGMTQEDLAEHVIGEEKEVRTQPLTRLLRWMRKDWRDRDGNLRSVADVKALTDAALEAHHTLMAKAS